MLMLQVLKFSFLFSRAYYSEYFIFPKFCSLYVFRQRAGSSLTADLKYSIFSQIVRSVIRLKSSINYVFKKIVRVWEEGQGIYKINFLFIFCIGLLNLILNKLLNKVSLSFIKRSIKKRFRRQINLHSDLKSDFKSGCR